MKFKALPQALLEGVCILLEAAFFDGVVTYYIILHFVQQQVNIY